MCRRRYLFAKRPPGDPPEIDIAIGGVMWALPARCYQAVAGTVRVGCDFNNSAHAAVRGGGKAILIQGRMRSGRCRTVPEMDLEVVIDGEGKGVDGAGKSNSRNIPCG